MTSPAQSSPVSPALSARSLLKSTAIAALIAGAILVTIVMPAEYGVDPTRVGSVLGLKEMGEIKMRLAREDADHDPEAAGTAPPATACPPTPPATGSSTSTTPRTER